MIPSCHCYPRAYIKFTDLDCTFCPKRTRNKYYLENNFIEMTITRIMCRVALCFVLFKQ